MSNDTCVKLREKNQNELSLYNQMLHFKMNLLVLLIMVYRTLSGPTTISVST